MAQRASAYQRFDGTRSRRPAWIPVYTASLRRGWASPWVRKLTAASLFLAFGLTLLLYVAYQVVPEWQEIVQTVGAMAAGESGGGEFKISSKHYLGLLNLYVYPLLLPLSLLFGQDLIAKDLESNALESYFTRPLTPWGYLFGRTLAFVSFLLLATLVPMLWIWTFDVLSAPAGHFADVASFPLGVSAAMLLVSLTMALLVQAMTALTGSGTWANLCFVAIFLFSVAGGGILFGITGDRRMLAVSLLHDVEVVCALLIGTLKELDDSHPPPLIAAAVIFGLLLLSLFILTRRIRRKGVVG